jgi:hypothetical protein
MFCGSVLYPVTLTVRVELAFCFTFDIDRDVLVGTGLTFVGFPRGAAGTLILHHCIRSKVQYQCEF